jgi:hypothetical protein
MEHNREHETLALTSRFERSAVVRRVRRYVRVITHIHKHACAHAHDLAHCHQVCTVDRVVARQTTAATSNRRCCGARTRHRRRCRSASQRAQLIACGEPITRTRTHDAPHTMTITMTQHTNKPMPTNNHTSHDGVPPPDDDTCTTVATDAGAAMLLTPHVGANCGPRGSAKHDWPAGHGMLYSE